MTRLSLRVYYEDTDAGGIVYHARYLAFAERARTEALRGRGASHDELATRHGLIFVVRRAEMDYLRPARLDDLLTVTTRTVAVGGASIVLRQEFSVEDRPIGVLRVKLACIGKGDGRPARIPPRWRAAFEAPEEGAGCGSGG